jgi:hypothetical protein
MPRASSAGSGLPPRWRARYVVPPFNIQRSLPREDGGGFALDLWAERETTPGETVELQQVARMLGCLPLMTHPTRCDGALSLTPGRLRASVALTADGRYEASWGAVAESNLADLWEAVHLAIRPEAAHVRSAVQLLAMARIQRAIG